MRQKSYAEVKDRAAELTAERNRKMAASAHAYVRGSTERFYQWLEDSNRAAVPAGPDAWICGDCHVGNLGPIAGTDGGLAIQIRDLDQTVIGNPAHDLIRLALSMAMAARSSGLPGVTTVQIIERMIQGYEQAFADRQNEAQGGPADAMPKAIKTLMREAAGRSWKHLADERIEGVAPVIPRGKRFWPLRDQEHRAIDELFAQEDTRKLVTALRHRDDDAELRVLDAAFWRKGCSSLGNLRFAVLAAIDSGKRERHCLIDIKQAVSAAAPYSRNAPMPEDDADRVVTGAQHLSPFLGQRMLAAHILGKPVFMRELLPQDLKLEVERFSHEEAMQMAEFLARVVGHAHARQLTAADRKAWLKELQRNRSKSLDAPSWLWNSVVELISAHEAAYLNHCRRQALQEAA